MEKKLKQKIYNYRAIFEPLAEGGYMVTFPSLPGCVTYGETIEEAVKMAHECAEGFIEALAKLGRPIPRETETLDRMGLMLKLNLAHA